MKFRKKEKNTHSAPDPGQPASATCSNCGHESSGRYCSNCGQKFEDVNKPFKDIFGDFIGMFNLDASIFKTIGPFLFKPGFLSAEYLAGKRKTYLSPLRLYLFLSVVFFFLARNVSQLDTGNGIFDIKINEDDENPVLLSDSAAIALLKSDSLFYGKNFNPETDDSLRSEDIEAFRRYALNVKEKESQFISELLNYLSYALFLLMPMFALLLKLLYIRRKHLYIEHLIFSINMHSFALLVLSVAFAFQLLLNKISMYTDFLMLIIPVYFVAGMKRFYGQGWLKIILKTLLLGIIYTLLMGVTFIVFTALTIIRL